MSAERERLLVDVEEAEYEQMRTADKLHHALQTAAAVPEYRERDYEAFKRLDAARQALAAFDAAHPKEETK